jgi:uridine phosphorylase
MIKESELIINPDGSIYHLKLKPEHLAKTVIVVGDPGRVELISGFFDKIEYKIKNREFVTHTGFYNNKRISVIATGIGTDNIDIVMNEIDALVNIDLKTREIKSKKTKLDIIRIGTSGALQRDVEVDSFVIATHGLGLDGLLNYYAAKDSVTNQELSQEFIKQSNWDNDLSKPYIIDGSSELIKSLEKGFIKGITATAPGFYGPQGRKLRLDLAVEDINEKLSGFSYKEFRIMNFEMETSAIYGLSKMLGHNAVTVCAIIANRYHKTYSKDYKKTVRDLIKNILEKL